MEPLGVTEHEPDTLEDAFVPCGVYVAVPLDAFDTVTFDFVRLTEPVVVPLTLTSFAAGVTVVVYVLGTATVPLPLALSLNASTPRPDRSPNACHSVPLKMNSALPYVTMSPDTAVALDPLIVMGFVVDPSVIAVVVAPRNFV